MINLKENHHKKQIFGLGCCPLFIFIFVLFLYFISLDHLVPRLNFDIQFVKINIRRCISIYIIIPREHTILEILQH